MGELISICDSGTVDLTPVRASIPQNQLLS